MEWAEFLLSDEFTAYRKRQAEAIAKTVHGVLTNFQEPDAKWLKGALDMAIKLVRLPREIIQDDKKLGGRIGQMIEKDMADVSAFLVQRSFTSSDDEDDMT